MEAKKYDPLNPDSEQQLFEKLAYTEEDRENLDYIRKMMKRINEPSKYDSVGSLLKGVRNKEYKDDGESRS